jgi:hypothetical protein
MIEMVLGSALPSKAPSKFKQKELENLLNQRYMWQSKSPYGAHVLFVDKKDGKLRLCIDYHALNKNNDKKQLSSTLH